MALHTVQHGKRGSAVLLYKYYSGTTAGTAAATGEQVEMMRSFGVRGRMWWRWMCAVKTHGFLDGLFKNCSRGCAAHLVYSITG
jgi:hypothetical protein